MDVVYTFVDGDNSTWRKEYHKYTKVPISDIRYCNHGELLFSIKLLKLHCSWVDKIYVVHSYISLKLKKSIEAIHPVIWVPQKLLYPYPCFNSCVIESVLWKIPNLSEFFVYLNDDMFIGRKIELSHFLRNEDVPWIDMSKLTINNKIENMAKHHNQKALQLFNSKYNTNYQYHISHYPFLVSRSACKTMHELYAKEITILNSQLIRSNKCFNFLLISCLHMIHECKGIVRVRLTEPPYNFKILFIENENHLYVKALQLHPHFFCINGVTKGTQRNFIRFCELYLKQVNY